MEKENGIIFNTIDDVLKGSMISYAEDVILDRALPRVEDGLKPVQRRILFAMYEMGLTPDKPHKKCAKIVGDCLGKYHPHGDSSVYGALVHLAQDFNMRMPLINGHGNFGTVDGDTPAAYRYTEAKLESLALELLRDIDKDTVDFSLNFDDSLKEPNTLPGRFPNLLVNGTTGIAVGLATNIPTHNLTEVINGTVAFIDNPKITLKNMMKYIPAPDFPTGGFILAGEELEEAYKTGKGKIKIRARVTIEKEGNDKQNLVISELPYQVNKAELLKKIVELREDKKDILSGIGEVVDESDRNGMRAVIKLKKDADANKILSYLYKTTSLEVTFGINMIAIAGGKPAQLGLLDIISYYVNYQRDIIYRRSKFELERAKERAHILEGLLIAVKNIDEVIKIIKSAENTSDAREKLKNKFLLTDQQAIAILDLRLAKLTKLEAFKLEQELKDLKILIENLTEIIASKTKQMEVVKSELIEIKKKYKSDRRSKIISVSSEDETFSENDFQPIEDFVCAFTYGNNLKKITQKNFNNTERKIKENSNINDFIKFYVNVKSNQTIFAITNLGNMVKFKVSELPECKYKDKGISFNEISSEILKNETPVAFFVSDEEFSLSGYNLIYTKNGLIKKSDWKEYSLVKNYFQAIKLKEKDEVIFAENEIKDTTIAFITENGLILNALKDDLPIQGRIAGGVKGINLNDGDSIKYVSQIDDEGEFIIITDAGLYKRVISSEIETMARYRKGIKICELSSKTNKIIFAFYVKQPFDIGIIDNFGVSFSVNTEDISIESRTTKGKTLKNENKKRLPEKAFKIL